MSNHTEIPIMRSELGPSLPKGGYQEEAKQHQCGQHKQDQADDFSAEFKGFAQRVMDRIPKVST